MDAFTIGKDAAEVRMSRDSLLEIASYEEDGNVALTWELLRAGQLGEKGGETLNKIEAALRLLTEMASCQWGCRGGDHMIENMVRRLCNYGHSALRLAFSGYYEEALSPLRSLAEGDNLLQLFSADPSAAVEWKDLRGPERRKMFTPYAVRRRLEKFGQEPAVREENYRSLCEASVHIVPDNLALSHDPGRRVYVGACFSIPGLFLVISKAAPVLAVALTFSANLLGPQDRARIMAIRDTAHDLMQHAPALRITRYAEFFDEHREARMKEEVLDAISRISEEEWLSLVEGAKSQAYTSGQVVDFDHATQTQIETHIYPAIYNILSEKRRAEWNAEQDGWLKQATRNAYLRRLEAEVRAELPHLLKEA
jgi:hypothetical protein